eukprot:gene11676-35243_t
MAAASKNHADVVLALLLMKADVHQGKSDDGATALYLAAQEGHYAACKVLLEHGARPNDVTIDDGSNALWMASQDGYHHADPNIPDTENAASPLMMAAQSNHLASVAALLGAGADPNAGRTDDGAAAVHFVCESSSSLPCLTNLLSNGANPNLQMIGAKGKGARTHGYTPAYLAAFQGRLDTIKCIGAFGGKLSDEYNISVGLKPLTEVLVPEFEGDPRSEALAWLKVAAGWSPMRIALSSDLDQALVSALRRISHYERGQALASNLMLGWTTATHKWHHADFRTAVTTMFLISSSGDTFCDS